MSRNGHYHNGRKAYNAGLDDEPPYAKQRYDARSDWMEGYYDAKAEDPDAPEYTPEMNGTAIPPER